MQVFEFHFNPPSPGKSGRGKEKFQNDLLFDSFCYEPENIYEKRLGSLFVVGEMKNVLPQNSRFLDNFAGFLKRQYYSGPVRFSPETCFRESLKKSNEFLESIAKKGDVSWLGNLNLGVLGVRSFELNFSKVGAIKILLLRNGQIVDIGKNLEFSEIEPYPLKIFDNIVSGKLLENDIILVLTKEIFPVFSEGSNSPIAFQQKNQGKKKFAPYNHRGSYTGFTPLLAKKFSREANSLLEKIAQLVLLNYSENKSLAYGKNLVSRFAQNQKFPDGFTEQNMERKLKEILKTKEQDLLNVSGVCFLLLLAKETWQKQKERKSFTFQAPKEEFSFRKALSPLTKELKKINTLLFSYLKKGFKLRTFRLRLKNLISSLRFKLTKMPKLPDLKEEFLKFKNFFGKSPDLKRNLILILGFLFFLALGFLIFKR